MLERLSEFPGDDWLAQVVPVLTEVQRLALKEKFKQEYQQAKDRVAKPPLGDTENNARAGRILGWLGDKRKGVGLDSEGLPDIDWVDIKAPHINYRLNENRSDLKLDNKGKLVLDYDYKMARYPITWLQFQSFIDHPNGYRNDNWLKGLNVDPDERRIESASWPIPNHPRDTINWFQCLAFCRWLNKVKKPGDSQLISLPSEWEWHYAVCGGDMENFRYPWGAIYQSGYANINETRDKSGPLLLKQTTTVGVYPHGATSHPATSGLTDMSGNVWEWCLNQAENKNVGDISLNGVAVRTLRGGSWVNASESASRAFRLKLHPANFDSTNGFRVVCVPSNRRTTDH